ncbi:MAG: DNA methyltransferase [Cytophagales bacterium]|nr:DNA methyltransferase [Cytophagales bacterium]
MNSETVDLIYLDPPWNKNDTFVGSQGKGVQKIKEWFIEIQKRGEFPDKDFEVIFKDGPSFKDIWRDSDVNQEWHSEIDERVPSLIPYLSGIKGHTEHGGYFYLIFMMIRLMELKRILKPTGSIYLHCDPTMSHYLKLLMDIIFGDKNFQNEIVWNYKGTTNSPHRFARKHDVLLLFTKGTKHLFFADSVRVPYENSDKFIQDKTGRWYKKWSKGKNYYPAQLFQDGKWVLKGKYQYDVWNDIPSMSTSHGKEYLGYPTQKPLKLLERIIKASSKKGDLVLDPFCGCATTCVAAENLGRKWVGIDESELSYYMNYYRLRTWDPLLQEGKAPPAIFLIDKKDDFPVREFASHDEKEEYDQRRITRKDVEGIRQKRKKKMPLKKEDEAALRELLYHDQGGLCAGCDYPKNKHDFHLDHIKPKSKDGVHDETNRQLLCGSCNLIKGDRTMEDLWKRLVELKRITKATFPILRAKFERSQSFFNKGDTEGI